MTTPHRETGKDRWSRVPKDYFKRPDRLLRTRLYLSLAAFLVTAGYAASGLLLPGGRVSSTDVNSLRANHGDLARAHVAWETECDACHIPFMPIDGRSLLAASTGPADRAGDRLCSTCHAAPAHHASVLPSEVKSCAGCHRDHQGRDFSLVRLEDGECTRCHAALDSHMRVDVRPGGSRAYQSGIVAFREGQHPAFRSEHADYPKGLPPVDRGNLKFSHARHLRPGIVARPGDRPFRVGMIPIVSERPRYGPDDDKVVQLDCKSCHVLGTEDGAQPGPATKGSGAYYEPPRYEKQCRACHPLTFDPRTPSLEAPHGLQPAEVSAFLRRTYAAQLLSDDPRLLDEFRPRSPLPGKPARSETARKKLDDATGSAGKFLFAEGQNNCAECHFYAGNPDRDIVPEMVKPTSLPTVWYPHAVFDHSAHRAVACRECHGGAEKSTTRADVLIPGMDNCVRCHAGRETGNWFLSPAGKVGIASANCVECHRYHGGDRKAPGGGVVARDVTPERTIADFLRGR